MSTCGSRTNLFMAKDHQNLETPTTKPLPRLSIPGDHSPSMDPDIQPFFHHTIHLPEFIFPQSPASFEYSGVCYNEWCYNERMLQRMMLQRTMLQRKNATTKDATTNDATTNDVTRKECYNERILQRMMLQRTMLQRKNATTNDATMKESYNERCYNERTLQRTMPQRKNATKNDATTKECYIEQRCWNKRGGILWADVARACSWRVGPSALIRASVVIFVIVCMVQFLRYSYQFSSVICLFVPLAVNLKKKIIQLDNFSHQPAK